MKRLISVATLSALLAVGAYASTTAFAANISGAPSTAIVSVPRTPPTTISAPEPPEAPGTESATEPVEVGTASEPAELAGDTGHADAPLDQNADHQFDGDE